jgi:hypothetical protein
MLTAIRCGRDSILHRSGVRPSQLIGRISTEYVSKAAGEDETQEAQACGTIPP